MRAVSSARRSTRWPSWLTSMLSRWRSTSTLFTRWWRRVVIVRPLLWGVPVIPKTFDFSKMSLWKLGVNASFSSIPFSQNLRCFGSSSENPPKIFSSCAQAPTLQDFRFGFTNSIWQEDSPQKRSYYYYYSLINSNLTFHISYQHNTSTQHNLIYLQQENLFLISHYVFIGSSFHSHFLLYFFVSIW